MSVKMVSKSFNFLSSIIPNHSGFWRRYTWRSCTGSTLEAVVKLTWFFSVFPCDWNRTIGKGKEIIRKQEWRSWEYNHLGSFSVDHGADRYAGHSYPESVSPTYGCVAAQSSSTNFCCYCYFFFDIFPKFSYAKLVSCNNTEHANPLFTVGNLSTLFTFYF